MCGKSSQISPKPVLICWSSIPYVYSVCIYTLLRVVGYYDLSVLSMSVMGFKKKEVWMGVGGWGELYPSFFWDFCNCFNFAKPLSKIEQVRFSIKTVLTFLMES